MINYRLLANSQDHYEVNGFQRIESPWTVTKPISNLTKPPNAKEFELKGDKQKVLVASGEQSFLYLYLKGFLPKGQFQTTTPCYRDEVFDATHTKYFIKNELIKTDRVNSEELEKMMRLALDFFQGYFLTGLHLNRISESEIDITSSGVEIGSYGIRQCSFLPQGYIYGTGCAEPRTSSAPYFRM
jgi:hypothetical protein